MRIGVFRERVQGTGRRWWPSTWIRRWEIRLDFGAAGKVEQTRRGRTVIPSVPERRTLMKVKDQLQSKASSFRIRLSTSKASVELDRQELLQDLVGGSRRVVVVCEEDLRREEW